ncbi:hypothetical protein HPB48_017878 [Haemaphysalis longicornis]|uniref:Tick transposon n=1 Tax=Haemaphysalis longicornis TaxID=44386 RepID=A0A9J6GR82_HAELO|nr:hypothetical protein HPB48_017878 [Haemaphysalis longicornis]
MMVAVLNLHGARSEQKWGELTKQMRDEHIAVFAVIETHLREEEAPPNCKRSAAALVQTSIRRANKQFMEELKAAGRQAPKRFWQKIKRDARTVTGTSLRAPEGNTVEEKGCLPELQQLLDTCAMGMTERHLVFKPAKCVVMAWGVEAQQTTSTWHLPRPTIHLVPTAKYLGMRLTTRTSCYLAERESELKARASRSKGMLVRQSLWSFNRALWKLVVMPGITYGNAGLCLSSGTREFLERCQRWVRRLALGTHGQCTTEAVQGVIGEAVVKASNENGLLRLPVTNVTRQTLQHTIYASQPTRWTKRTRALRDRFGLPAATLVTVNPSREVVRAQMQRSEKAEWLGLATSKPSLLVYCTYKENIRRETLFDNSRCNGLLAEARAGVLRTRVWRAGFTAGLSTTCALCGGAEETIAHVVVNCPDILPAARTPAVRVALGFAEEATETERGEVVDVTKRRLKHCWSHGAPRQT